MIELGYLFEIMFHTDKFNLVKWPIMVIRAVQFVIDVNLKNNLQDGESNVEWFSLNVKELLATSFRSKNFSLDIFFIFLFRLYLITLLARTWF